MLVSVVSPEDLSRRSWKKSSLRISDSNGKMLQDIPLDIKEGFNEILYEHGYQNQGVIHCSLIIDGKVFTSRKMVFSN